MTDLETTLTPEQELNLAYSDFRNKYNGIDVRDMPDDDGVCGPYSDYINIMEIHARRNMPVGTIDVRIEVLNDVMQRYAESHRDE